MFNYKTILLKTLIMFKCKGNGECLYQYSFSNIIDGSPVYCRKINWDCPVKCQPVKCKGYRFCQQMVPKWMLDFHDGLCSECFNLFSRAQCQITMEPEYECPVCLEIKQCFSQINCKHVLCIECYRRIYFEGNKQAPRFPFPEAEMYYVEIGARLSDLNRDDFENVRFSEHEWNVIVAYENLLEQWIDNYLKNVQNRINFLGRCPLCRQ